MKLEDKIKYSIELIKRYEQTDKYFLAFSGGKDSICIYQLTKMAKVEFQAYYSRTTVDPPDIRKFIKKYFPDVIFLKPELSMFKLIAYKKKFLPTRKNRYCCELLKEYAGNGKFVMTGIRKDESHQRSKRDIYEKDNRKKYKGTQYLHPIFEWSEKDVWEFIKQKKLPFPDLYLGCFSRIGCIGCPMAYYKNRLKEFELYPKFKKMYIRAIKIAMQDKTKKQFWDFENEYEVFEWWTGGISKKQYLANKKQLKIPYLEYYK